MSGYDDVFWILSACKCGEFIQTVDTAIDWLSTVTKDIVTQLVSMQWLLQSLENDNADVWLKLSPFILPSLINARSIRAKVYVNICLCARTGL